MKSFVIGFSGSIRSGKTTISKAVAQRLGCVRVSFGDYLRTVAKRRGIDDVRENLQSLGAELVGTDVRQFCASIIAEADYQPGQTLLIDGIRHSAVIDEIKRLVAPAEFKLIFVSVSDECREVRSSTTMEIKPLKELDLHPTEDEVTTLVRRRADFLVDGERPIDVIVDDILEWMKLSP